MDKTISRDQIEYALNNAGIDFSDLNDTYAGRGMYGETCLSFTLVGKRVQRSLCQFFVWLTNELVEDQDGLGQAHQLAADVCTDDLGLDMIVYFPGWKLSD
jgi:hypothetical protein